MDIIRLKDAECEILAHYLPAVLGFCSGCILLQRHVCMCICTCMCKRTKWIVSNMCQDPKTQSRRNHEVKLFLISLTSLVSFFAKSLREMKANLL